MLTEKVLAGSLHEEQIKLEEWSVSEGVKTYYRNMRDAIKRGEGANLKPAERLMLYWYEPVRKAIRQQQKLAKKGKRGNGRSIWGPYLTMLPAPRAAVVVLHEALSRAMQNPGGVKVAQQAYAIGRAIMSEINMDLIRKHDRGLPRHEKITTHLNKRYKHLDSMLINRHAKKSLEDPVWDQHAKLHMGMAMLWILIENCILWDDNGKPTLGFHHEHRRERGGVKTPAFIRLDDQVHDLLDQDHNRRAMMRPKYLPMLVPPYPYSNDQEGGYARLRTPLIRKITPDQRRAIKNADLTKFYEHHKAIESTPWRIKTQILDVLEHVWQTGGGVPDVPPANNYPMPPRVDTDDEDLIRKNKEERASVHDDNEELKGERRFFEEQLGVARMFRDRARFWFTHSYCFRWRAYPWPQYLHYQERDLARALLEFANGKPVRRDSEDYNWLYIQLANHCGVNGLSYDDRITWAKDNMERFRKWAEDPIQNMEWDWIKDEKPWQALSVAMALFDDEQAAHLPVHIDGTCNGLQHYAAMMRDEDGAALVNLIPNEKPSDVYVEVLNRVIRRVEEDLSNHDPFGRTEYTIAEIANHAINLLSRKVVKRPVMTKVYNVTQTGATRQTGEEVPKLGGSYSVDMAWPLYFYIARTTLSAFGELCSGAQEAMQWLMDCAKSITKSGEVVEWDTPLGCPVVQPYCDYRDGKIRTTLQNLHIQRDEPNRPPRKGKQKDAVAPNFIHSIDSTHMLMTGRAAFLEGMDFAAAHDDFATHAVDTTQLQAMAIDKFIELHSTPLLHWLHRQWQMKYPDVQFPEPPALGSFDINSVSEATYSFS